MLACLLAEVRRVRRRRCTALCWRVL